VIGDEAPAQKFDVMIAGAGAAGLVAGTMAARRGLRSLILAEGGVGGAIANVTKIEDFPGYPEGIAGYELGPMLEEQAGHAGSRLQGDSLLGVSQSDYGWNVSTTGGEVSAAAVILAMGTRPRRLEVPGEERLIGSGVSTCASCDGPFFRDQHVVVVGAGDSGLSEALELRELGVQVTIVDRELAIEGQATYSQRVLEDSEIDVRLGSEITEIFGEERVNGIILTNLQDGANESMACTGVFVCTGRVPNSEGVAGTVELETTGHIKTDSLLRTSRSGVFAAGDIRSGSIGQAAAAAGDGAMAAAAAHKYLIERPG